MEFQTLKKSYKKQIVIGALAVCVIGGALTFNLTRAKYKLTQDIPLVRGTINYKMPDLRIVAVNTSEDGTNYNIADEIPTEGYNFNSEKSVCKVATETSGIENAPKDTNITIEYKDGKVNILGVAKKGTRCYLYFDKKDTDTIHVAFGDIEVKKTTPTFSNIAESDEGVYKVSDPVYGGHSYYWRGAVTNNYVKFANKCWRIVRINGDKSIRLIYDGTTCHANGTSTSDSIAVASTAYNTSYNRSNYVGWTYTPGIQRPINNDDLWDPSAEETASNVKTKLESWYNSNIGNNTTYSSKVADGKYCNDRNVGTGGSSTSWSASGTSFYYAGLTRRGSNSPSLACNLGDVYTLKVGLITSDEVMYAGGRAANNTSYYLYNGQHYWTMSPSGWYSSSAWVFLVNANGFLNDGSLYNTFGLRPVINLKADTLFAAGGNGTQSNPYVVSD